VAPVINIFQPYYLKEHLGMLDKTFIPYDNTENPHPELCEYYLFKKINDELQTIDADYIGLFSYKFNKKALITGQDVKQFMYAHPGFDVYLFNPYPYESYIFHDIWEHGEYYHSGITELTQEALNKAGYDFNLKTMHRAKHLSLHCNFWVGTKQFWHDYLNFLTPLADIMQSDSRYFNLTTYELGPTAFFPFKSNHRVCSYQYPESFFTNLTVNDTHTEAYQLIAPLIREFDECYGDHWPISARNKLVQLREDVMHDLSRKGISKELRF
jgi:hypothetical protein